LKKRHTKQGTEFSRFQTLFGYVYSKGSGYMNESHPVVFEEKFPSAEKQREVHLFNAIAFSLLLQKGTLSNTIACAKNQGTVRL
jgi:hypothetical protein